MAMVEKKTIDEFYAQKKIALIGASRSKKKYGGGLLKELLEKGYEAIPVNPHAKVIQNRTCYKNIKDIPEEISAAIAIVPSSAQEQVVLDAAEAGVKTLWLHEHVMKGVSNPKAIYLCEEKGMTCITGFCPFMFIPDAGFPHNIHKSIMKLFKALPQ